jgi:uncharacterized protein YqjF (DUF2071 family)
VDVEPVTDTAPRPAGRTLFTQGWRDVAFLHWAVDPALVARLLPREPARTCWTAPRTSG